ncbi:MAG TPA: glycerophosphodiester phosphodiesterase family protein [Blastocatellia bacterium]|nr:glycerophosphodiester phosphodiesterase family protein [Blastocatellia bacterium]
MTGLVKPTVAGRIIMTLVAAVVGSAGLAAGNKRPILIAHRGASAYAPEHTLSSYRLAIEQGADFVEQDLQVTKDGVLICLHDPELSRTTNVAEVYPARAATREVEGAGNPRRGWYAVDFTLEEIKRLDAGSWFNRANPFAARETYVGERIPTLEEVISAVGNRAGLYIEMKESGFYKSAGIDVAAKLAAVLDGRGFKKPAAGNRIFVQSFSKENLLRLKQIAPHYRRIQLLPMEDAGRRVDSRKVTPELAGEIAEYAQGVGPAKEMLASAADVETFHRAGLLIHPYTFRGPTTAVVRQPLDKTGENGAKLRDRIVSEIRRFAAYGIDGGFTDYPDLWREAVSPPRR